MLSFVQFSSIAALAALLPAVQGHVGLWDPSAFGFNRGDNLVTPLSGKSFNDWWFHGNLNDRPSEVKTLVPGQDLTLQLACSKSYTTFGNNPSSDACPGDAGSYHAGGRTGDGSGWGGNNEDNLLGCALAIAFKSNAADVKPEDFTVMSVQERCVRQRDTNFAIPANLPACPDGECTCAWFWQGKNSANEMYMTGFRCNVQGGSSGAIPRPAQPRRNQIEGPTQPMYWANDVNNVGYEPEWANKPSYNSAWGWTNGAQTGAFGAGGGGGGGGNNPPVNSTSEGSTRPTTSTGGWGDDTPTSSEGSSSPTSSTGGGGGGGGDWNGGENTSTTSSRRRRRPRPTSTEGGNGAQSTPNWNVHAADPTGSVSAAYEPQASGTTGGQGKESCGRKRRKRSRAHHNFA